MRPMGYLYKKVAQRPDWLHVTNVKEVCSLSSCVSESFSEYINYWKHNGYWLFNSPSVILSIAAEHSLELSDCRLFYYEVFELEFDEDKCGWEAFSPDASFCTSIVQPTKKTLLGFDVTTFPMGAPECSPLSCNSSAEYVPTNEHCLFSTFQEAKDAIELDKFRGCEPGPYRIVTVYTVDKF